MRPALLVIDPQIDFVGMVQPDSADAALAGMRRLVEAAREGGTPIVFTQELHRPGAIDMGRELEGDEPLHCVEGTPGAALVPGFEPRPGEYLIQKRRYSAFFATDLLLLLRGLAVDTVVTCGMLSDVCVHYTCVDAHQHDLHLHVVPEACAGSSRLASQAAFAAIGYLQRGAVLDLGVATGLLGGRASGRTVDARGSAATTVAGVDLT